MTREEFENQLQEIAAIIEHLPQAERGRLNELLAETRTRFCKNKRARAGAQAALDDWRILAKYRVFDYEATARELEAGRRRLEAEEDGGADA